MWAQRIAGLILLSAATPTVAAVLDVSVAISLKPVVAELATGFEQAHPGTKVRLHGGASGLLVQQVRRGAPCDLFVSASHEEIDLLASYGLILRSLRAPLAVNRLVLVGPTETSSRLSVDALVELSRGGDLAVGNPRTAPLGRYTQQALEALGVWKQLRPRLVFGENARQVLEYAARGEVAVAIVYESDVRLAANRVRVGSVIEPSRHAPIRYEAAVIASSDRRDLARSLLTWLSTPESRAVFESHGFSALPRTSR